MNLQFKKWKMAFAVILFMFSVTVTIVALPTETCKTCDETRPEPDFCTEKTGGGEALDHCKTVDYSDEYWLCYTYGNTVSCN